MNKLLIILSFLLFSSTSLAEENDLGKLITLSPTECEQHAIYVMLEIGKAQGRFQDRDPHAAIVYSNNALKVGKFVVDLNKDSLEKLSMEEAYVDLLSACLYYKGETRVPEGV